MRLMARDRPRVRVQARHRRRPAERPVGVLRSLAGLIDGFKERGAVEALLRSPETTFLLVTSPEPEPVEEAIFFHGACCGGHALRRRDCQPRPPGHLARTRHGRADGRAFRTARPSAPAKCWRASRAPRARQARPRRIKRLRAALGEPEPLLVPFLADDVHDLAGLQRVGVICSRGTGRDGARPRRPRRIGLSGAGGGGSRLTRRGRGGRFAGPRERRAGRVAGGMSAGRGRGWSRLSNRAYKLDHPGVLQESVHR